MKSKLKVFLGVLVILLSSCGWSEHPKMIIEEKGKHYGLYESSWLLLYLKREILLEDTLIYKEYNNEK
jgi:hypothetical protein